MRKTFVKVVLAGAAAALLFALFIFVRASLPAGRPEDREGPVLKVSVSRSGVIAADGVPVTLGQLEPLVRRMKSVDGTVWYHRERTPRPPAEVMQVVKLVIDHGVPISLSGRPDFSDYIDKEGRSRPRKKASHPPATASAAR
jgi:hypothetical protein